MHSPHHVLLIGLPSTGKTSFLAALWYAIQQNSCPTGLVLKKLDGNSSYLNLIRESWLAFKPVPRTPTDSETHVSMWLKRRTNDEEIHLSFPDVSGEAFLQQWTTRLLSATYKGCLESADSAMFFIHSRAISRPLNIIEVDSLASLIDEKIIEEAAEIQTTAPALPIAWDPEKSPTQVQLVELLQVLMQQGSFKAPFRLAVMISAWDLVSTSTLSPDQWVGKEMPLLAQFLSSNRSFFETSFYGISAQGGAYEVDGIRNFHDIEPAERINIVGQNVANSHDITEPLLWLMR